jgi:hypothetical protein
VGTSVTVSTTAHPTRTTRTQGGMGGWIIGANRHESQ